MDNAQDLHHGSQNHLCISGIMDEDAVANCHNFWQGPEVRVFRGNRSNEDHSYSSIGIPKPPFSLVGDNGGK